MSAEYYENIASQLYVYSRTVSNLQPPRPGGSGGNPSRPSNLAVQPVPNGGRSGLGAPNPQNRLRLVQGGGAVSARTVLGTFVTLLVVAVVSIFLAPSPFSQQVPELSNVVGFFAGLFGCTLIFGLLQFFVNQQYAAGTFADWNFPVSKITFAKAFTAIGWIAGGINGYIIAIDIARSVA
jgi:hypothetical protein